MKAQPTTLNTRKPSHASVCQASIAKEDFPVIMTLSIFAFPGSIRICDHPRLSHASSIAQLSVRHPAIALVSGLGLHRTRNTLGNGISRNACNATHGEPGDRHTTAGGNQNTCCISATRKMICRANYNQERWLADRPPVSHGLPGGTY